MAESSTNSGGTIRPRRGVRTVRTATKSSSGAAKSPLRPSRPTHNLSGSSGSGIEGDYCEDEESMDECDRAISQHSPHFYPDLSDPDFDHSPMRSPKKSPFGSPNKNPSKTNCESRTGPSPKVPPENTVPPKTIQLPPEIRVCPPSRGPMPILLIFICTVVIIGGIFVFNKLNEEELKPKESKRIKSIEEIYSDLKTSLREINHETIQSREVWVQLMGQIGSIMIEKPLQPAVILVVVPQDSKATATCLIHTLARIIKESFEDTKFVMFDVSSGSVNDPGRLKLELDKSLKGLDKAHVAVIHNIEMVPGFTAMMFHAYCDNENAPFKQAVILPMMEIPEDYNTAASTRLDDYITERLNKLWGVDLKEKDISAIISRIANAPILIKPEPQDTIENLCRKV